MTTEDPRKMKMVSYGYNFLHPWYSEGNFPFFVASGGISFISNIYKINNN